MQIPKFFLVGCAAIFCLLPRFVRAADTDSQAKAREALRQKMNELQPQPAAGQMAAPTAAPVPDETPRPDVRWKKNTFTPLPGQITQPPTTTPALPPQRLRPPPVTPQKPAPAAPRPTPPAAPEVRPAAPKAQVVAAPSADAELTARQREAVRKKMQELQAGLAPTMATPARPALAAKPQTAPEPRPAVTPKPVPARPAVPAPPKRPVPTPEFQTPEPAPSAAQPAAPQPPSAPRNIPETPAPAPQATVESKPETLSPPSDPLVEAVRAAQTEATMKPIAETKKKTASMKPAPVFQPIAGPPLNISSAKQQRLAELLRRYQADEITPGQYHEQRAKILAEP